MHKDRQTVVKDMLTQMDSPFYDSLLLSLLCLRWDNFLTEGLDVVMERAVGSAGLPTARLLCFCGGCSGAKCSGQWAPLPEHPRLLSDAAREGT